MNSTPDRPEHDGSDLAELRKEIDELQAIPHEEVVNPLPKNIEDREPEAEPTDAIGSEDWNGPEAERSDR
ncbi:hypothetical protein ACFT30_09470 [Microbacterium ureisolvens]|uniref:hypothetical protein n=1 Tax=Microbacterium TaxID=33882 RepID=UPI000D642848|nr:MULTISPECIES: hypothetical protein [Microbacterium]